MTAEELLVAAKEKYDLGDWPGAIELATQAYEAGETQLALSQLLAASYYHEHLYPQSVEWHLKVLEASPEDKTALVNLPHCYVMLGQFKEAEAIAEKYLSLYPDAQGNYNLGYILLAQDESLGARVYLRKAIKLNCSNPLVWYYAGVADYNMGDYEAAIEYLQKALELIPEHSEAAYLLGTIYLKEEEFKDCVDMMSRVLYYEPNKHEALYYRALAKKELGDYKGAETDVNNLLKANDQFFNAEKDGKKYKITSIEVSDTGEFNFLVEQ